MNDLAKKLGITIRGTYSCPDEHTFYFLLDSKDLNSGHDILLWYNAHK